MSTKFVIVAGWLCETYDECTCGCGGLSQHEQYCGVQNIIQVDRLLDEHETFRATLAKVAALADTWSADFEMRDQTYDDRDDRADARDDCAAAIRAALEPTPKGKP